MTNKQIAYTDGACSGNPGPGGWAWMMGDEKDSDFLPNTTNNMAELMAIYKVIEFLDARSEITIITDSALAIGWLTGQFMRRNKDIDHFVSLMLDIIAHKGLTVTFEKVKGHSQNLGNNAVDRMARRQAEIAAYLRAKEQV